jgi:hypothetical protein
LLLSKVFCDALDHERLRFIFALSMKEVERPTAELFEVYLSGICKGDTFTAAEIDNVRQLLKASGCASTLIIELCFMELEHRLGHSIVGVWTAVKRDHQQALSHPSLAESARLKDLFTLTFRSHHSPDVPLEILCRSNLGEEDHRLLLSFFFYVVKNASSTAEQAWRVFVMLQSTGWSATTTDTETINEGTCFALLLKCSRDGEADVACRFAASCISGDLIPSANVPAARALVAQTFASSGAFCRALDDIEDHRLDPLMESNAPHLHGQLHLHDSVLRALTAAGDKSLDEAFFHLESRLSAKKAVSLRTLNLIVAGCSSIGDETRTVETLEAFKQFGTSADATSFELLIRSFRGDTLVERKQLNVLSSMQRAGVKPTASTFHAMLASALDASDWAAAKQVLKWCREHETPPDGCLCVQLVAELCAIGDADNAKKVIRHAQAFSVPMNVSELRRSLQVLKLQGATATQVADIESLLSAGALPT